MDLAHEKRLTEVESRSKSNTKRLDEVEKRQDSLDDLVSTVKVLADREKPEHDEQTQYLETKYIDGDVITTVYEVKDIPIPIDEGV